MENCGEAAFLLSLRPMHPWVVPQPIGETFSLS